MRIGRRLAAAGAMLALVGDAMPVMHVERWDLPGISSSEWESHPALDPRTGDLWFVRSDANFAGWHLLVSHCTPHGWSAPRPAPIGAPGLEADPWFSPDGATLWFISSRATGAMKSAALDIWRAGRDANGSWSPPERLPEPVNSDSAEWFPRPGPDGWLYFGSRRAGGLGKDDIWRARLVAGRWQVENLGPSVNSDGDEYEFQPSADGRFAILAADSGLYRVAHGPHGWQKRVPYGPEVNRTGTEIGPMPSPDGAAFLFSRDAGDGRSGELYVAREKPGGLWPRSCGVSLRGSI